MKEFVRFAAIGLLTMALVACGKTEEQKNQDHAKDLIEEQHKLVADLSAATPDSNWSDAELNAYEGKLNRLQQVESDLASLNGKDGISIYGGNNAELIQQRRDQLRSVRTVKKSTVGVSSDQDQLYTLVAKQQELMTQLNGKGSPKSSWSNQQLNDYIDLCRQIQDNIDSQLAIIDQNHSVVGDPSKYRADQNTISAMVSTDRALADDYLAARNRGAA